MSEEKKEEQYSSARELFEHNQKQIIERKERYYDKVINSLHLTAGKMDLLIVVLLLALVAVIVIGLLNR
ncbi:MAG: hypothetical protein II712_02280 [Erysipelotrichaceae bacterium]|nr:hypothetical protein [Erysipelotrichaceae bacterium]MBQ4253634.1 hypothetical protein [Erysipelotrichaceae bacterium]